MTIFQAAYHYVAAAYFQAALDHVGPAHPDGSFIIMRRQYHMDRYHSLVADDECQSKRVNFAALTKEGADEQRR